MELVLATMAVCIQAGPWGAKALLLGPTSGLGVRRRQPGAPGCLHPTDLWKQPVVDVQHVCGIPV